MQDLAGSGPYFYPRPPRGGRPYKPDSGALLTSYFYPRPPRGGRLVSNAKQMGWNQISTHALREEGDEVVGFANILDAYISTHALREEGDVLRASA